MAIGEEQAGLVLHDKYAGVDPFLHTLPQTGMSGLGLHIERIVAAVQADAHGLVQLLRSAARARTSSGSATAGNSGGTSS